MAAFIAKQMIGSQLNSVKGKFFARSRKLIGKFCSMREKKILSLSA
jgi:hypothetical protein